MQYSRVKDVEKWAYMRLVTGKQINTLHLVRMFSREQKDKEIKMLTNLLKASGQIAVSSQALTKHKRTKYQNKMMRVGRMSFYLFDRHYIPADIYPVIEQLKDDVYIYGLIEVIDIDL